MFVTKLVCFHDVLEENHVISMRSPILSKHQSSEKSLPEITFMCSDALDKNDKTYVVLCLRDKCAGAFPGADRSPASIVGSLGGFVGRRVCSGIVILVSDAADEFVAAADEMGLHFFFIAPESFSPQRSARARVFVPRSLKLVSRFALDFGLLLAVVVRWL